MIEISRLEVLVLKKLVLINHALAQTIGGSAGKEQAALVSVLNDITLRADLDANVNSRDALAEFFKWAMREGPWDGCDLDGAAVQDKAAALGLIVMTKYDPEKHDPNPLFGEGEDFYEFSPLVTGGVVGTTGSKP